MASEAKGLGGGRVAGAFSMAVRLIQGRTHGGPPALLGGWKGPVGALAVFLLAVWVTPVDRVVLAVLVMGMFIIFPLWRIMLHLER